MSRSSPWMSPAQDKGCAFHLNGSLLDEWIMSALLHINLISPNFNAVFQKVTWWMDSAGLSAADTQLFGIWQTSD